jgi:hypothetical protein
MKGVQFHPVAAQSKEFQRRRTVFLADLEDRLAKQLSPTVAKLLPEAFPAKLPSVDPKPLVPKEPR